MGIPMRGAKLSESVPRMEPHAPARGSALIIFGKVKEMNIISMISQLAEGFFVSVQIFVFTLLFSMPLGLLVAYYIFWLKMGTGYRFPAVIIAFVVNYAAYFAEIYRSGIESMPRGQYEAAEVLGYNRFQTFFKIIFPQVFKRVLPPVTNETITLVKDTSLAFTISVAEMFTVAKQIGAAQTSVMPLLAAGIFYYIFNLIVATGMEYLEKRFSYYR